MRFSKSSRRATGGVRNITNRPPLEMFLNRDHDHHHSFQKHQEQFPAFAVGSPFSTIKNTSAGEPWRKF
ncbi:MAG: hypothetical protein ABGX47_11115 [Martelella sp.]